MAQQVKDPALSLLWLGSLLWHRFNLYGQSCQGISLAMGSAKKILLTEFRSVKFKLGTLDLTKGEKQIKTRGNARSSRKRKFSVKRKFQIL